MKLYKYVTPERIDILRHGMIRFTQPHAFNDPFEIADTVDSIYGRGANPLETALDRSKIGNVMLEVLGKVASRGLQQYFADQFGVLSLAEKPDNLLMWAHYARDHRGFVIELDGEQPFFHRRESEEDRLRHLRKVQYSRDRPAVALEDYNAADALLIKSVDWEYEQEWRMILPLDESSQKLETEVGSIHLFELPPACVTGLILGSRMSSADREPILELLVGEERYSHVAVRQAELSAKAFRLTLSESPLLHAKRAEKALLEQDLASALAHADRAIELAPGFDKGRYYGMRAAVHVHLGDQEAALRDFERLKELDPERYKRLLESAEAGAEP